MINFLQGIAVAIGWYLLFMLSSFLFPDISDGILYMLGFMWFLAILVYFLSKIVDAQKDILEKLNNDK